MTESSCILLQSELSTIREQLLCDFIPDDVCPLGGQLLIDPPRKAYTTGSTDSKSANEVITFHSFQFSLSVLGAHNLLVLCRLVHVFLSMMILL